MPANRVLCTSIKIRIILALWHVVAWAGLWNFSSPCGELMSLRAIVSAFDHSSDPPSYWHSTGLATLTSDSVPWSAISSDPTKWVTCGDSEVNWREPSRLTEATIKSNWDTVVAHQYQEEDGQTTYRRGLEWQMATKMPASDAWRTVRIGMKKRKRAWVEPLDDEEQASAGELDEEEVQAKVKGKGKAKNVEAGDRKKGKGKGKLEAAVVLSGDDMPADVGPSKKGKKGKGAGKKFPISAEFVVDSDDWQEPAAKKPPPRKPITGKQGTKKSTKPLASDDDGEPVATTSAAKRRIGPLFRNAEEKAAAKRKLAAKPASSSPESLKSIAPRFRFLKGSDSPSSGTEDDPDMPPAPAAGDDSASARPRGKGPADSMKSASAHPSDDGSAQRADSASADTPGLSPAQDVHTASAQASPKQPAQGDIPDSMEVDNDGVRNASAGPSHEQSAQGDTSEPMDVDEETPEAARGKEGYLVPLEFPAAANIQQGSPAKVGTGSAPSNFLRALSSEDFYQEMFRKMDKVFGTSICNFPLPTLISIPHHRRSSQRSLGVRASQNFSGGLTPRNILHLNSTSQKKPVRLSSQPSRNQRLPARSASSDTLLCSPLAWPFEISWCHSKWRMM